MKITDNFPQAYRNAQVYVYNRQAWSVRWRRLFWGVISLCLFAPLHAEPQDARAPIGQVTLVIGQAQAIDGEGQIRSLKRSDPIYAGETLQTEDGGHVHLRFIDDGTLSLRPKSRLFIELYQYDRQEPKKSAIRFSLESGVVRSVSGKATEAAHDRFRLNTPITAIGVLGTDFVVRAEAEKMWAGVYSGAIAIAALNDQCQTTGLGACPGATQLSETMGGVMLELSGRRAKEKIVPFDPNILSKAEPAPVAEPPHESTSAAPERITLAEIKVADAADELNVPQPQPPSVDLNVPQPPKVEVIVVKPDEPSPFAWARWGSQWPGDRMSQPYAQASEGRQVVVGNTQYALFRAPTALTELEPRAGVYDFNLAQGQVNFIGNGVSWAPEGGLPAQLDAARLQVDFAQRQFNTHLQMSHPLAGSARLDLNGAIQDNGVFLAKQPGSRVAGALSTEGGHASMFFEQAVKSGVFQGLTDWTRP